jgi:hypothetical protein
VPQPKNLLGAAGRVVAAALAPEKIGERFAARVDRRLETRIRITKKLPHNRIDASIAPQRKRRKLSWLWCMLSSLPRLAVARQSHQSTHFDKYRH